MTSPDLMAQVVLVSLNFRVSVLGGLYLPGGKVPGNQMMRDQVQEAGEWIKEIGFGRLDPGDF